MDREREREGEREGYRWRFLFRQFFRVQAATYSPPRFAIPTDEHCSPEYEYAYENGLASHTTNPIGVHLSGSGENEVASHLVLIHVLVLGKALAVNLLAPNTRPSERNLSRLITPL